MQVLEEVDHLTGVIENIIIGQPIPLGTGSVSVVMKPKKLEEADDGRR